IFLLVISQLVVILSERIRLFLAFFGSDVSDLVGVRLDNIFFFACAFQRDLIASFVSPVRFVRQGIVRLLLGISNLLLVIKLLLRLLGTNLIFFVQCFSSLFDLLGRFG